VKRISAQLGHVPLDKLTAQHLDRAYPAWLTEGLDPSSVHHLHRVISAEGSWSVCGGRTSTFLPAG